jgi:para-nitrobenzyl esterase
VHTDKGSVEGIIENGFKVFRGIPYAAPPVGDLRWRAPQPTAAWEGTLITKDYGPICPQLRPNKLTQSEDCLTLNITAPSEAEKLSVMLWIHGGGNVNGSGNIDGSAFTRDGIVFVSLNYRLGRLGTFAHPELSHEAASRGEPTGRFSVLDQIAALRWIKRNIAAFGGDPNRVTIFGVSAGGTNTNALMASPLAAGLFHGAIAQSGANGMSIPPPMADAEQSGISEAKSRGVEGIKGLRQLPWKELVNTRPSYDRQSETTGNEEVLGDDVPEVFRKGQQNDVPYIAGANSFEGSLARPTDISAIKLGLKDNIETIADTYNLKPDDPLLYRNFYGDMTFVAPTRYLVSQMANVDSGSWSYHMDYVLEEFYGKIPGTPHGGEVMFVFDFMKEFEITKGMSRLMKIQEGTYQSSEKHKAIASILHSYWVQFAKTGNPNGENLPPWPEYSIDNDNTLVISNDGFTVQNGFRKQQLDTIQTYYEGRRKSMLSAR